MAQNKNPFGSFGSFLGLPENVQNREELVKYKRQKSAESFRDQAASMSEGMTPSDSAIFQTFAQLGHALGGKINKGEKLTEEEEQGLQIMDAANKRMSTLRKSPEWIKMDPMQQSFEFQRILMDETGNAGDTEAYMQMAQDLWTKKMAYRQAVAETSKLESTAEVEGDRARVSSVQTTADLDLLTRGKPIAAASMVDGAPNLEELTTISQGANGRYYDEDGNEVLPGRDFLLQEDALKIEELRQKAGKGTLQPLDYFNDLYSKSEREKMRESVADINAITQVSNEMADVLSDTDPSSVVGNPGAINRFTSEAIKTLEGVGKTAKVFFRFDKDGNALDEGKGLFEAADEFISDDWVPQQFRDNAAGAARWKAAIMQMVYVDARLEEPGARQLSDADITNAMSRLGVNNSDPATVLQVFGSNVVRRINNTRTKLNYVANTLGPVGGEEFLSKRILGMDYNSTLDDAASKMTARFNEVSGTFDHQLTQGPETMPGVGSPAPSAPGVQLAPEDDAMLDNIMKRGR